MSFSHPSKNPKVQDMSPEDIAVIVEFARGSNAFREQAMEAYKRNMAVHGPRGNKYQRFMAEASNPVPDLALRARYRAEVLSED